MHSTTHCAHCPFVPLIVVMFLPKTEPLHFCSAALKVTLKRCLGSLISSLSLLLLYRPKSSFLPSYIIDVRELDEKLLNIIDMKFLHGYYEPTLLILFEPNQTWPGSVYHNLAIL